MIQNLLIDAREFFPGKVTGIGRVLNGLVNALAKTDFIRKITLAAPLPEAVPERIIRHSNVETKRIPSSFVRSEKALSDLSKQNDFVYLSPYPKFPFTGVHCPSINIVHDVLYITHHSYSKRIKTYIDVWRLKQSLLRADLTWFVSASTLKETINLIGFAGKNPKIRFSAIEKRFSPIKSRHDINILKKFELQYGYILIIGNGRPHKNLGIILQMSNWLSRPLVFIGLAEAHKRHWQEIYPNANAVWIRHVKERELSAVIRGAFCVALPSLAEGFGYPPLEAMACGVPAVVSDIPVLREISDGAACFANPNNPVSWFNAFKMLENQVEYDALVNKGLQRSGKFQNDKAWSEHIADIKYLMQNA
jgi:glycosyltransferase involved in cell wall biosynthesis